MKSLQLFILLSFVLISCGNAEKNGATNSDKVTAAPNNGMVTEKPVIPSVSSFKNKLPLEGIPYERIQDLWENCTYIDYIFHTMPFSMSQDEQGSIRANLNYIAKENHEFIPINCEPMARQMFHVNGEIVLEADVYLSQTCQFYVFVENEKPVYANKMTEDALDFFQTMFSKVDQQKR